MKDYEELKPCAFCNGTDIRKYAFKAALDVHYAVQCYCGARTEGQIEREAVENWNTRKPYDQLKADNEALRNALTYIRDTSDDWHVCEKAADALTDSRKEAGHEPV